MKNIKKIDINSEVILSLFLVIYPFLVFPWNLYVITNTKYLYLIAFTITLLCDYILNWLKKKRPLFMPQEVGERWIIIFFFLICLSTLFAENISISFSGFSSKSPGFIAWFCFIIIFLFSYNVIKIQNQLNILQFMIYGSFFCGIYGIIQHFFLDEIIGLKLYSGFTQSWAFFDNSNHFGSYLVLMLILGMTMYLLAKKRGLCVINWIIICTLFVSLLYTMARGAWLSVFIGMLLLTILVWKRKELWKRWILLLVSLLIILITINFTENNFLLGRIHFSR